MSWFMSINTNERVMTLYIVRAKNDLSGLREELELGKISKLQPFGQTLHQGLQNARFDITIVMQCG